MIYCKPCFSSCRRNSSLVDQVKIRLISQLIKRISRVLQKLLKYCSGTAILTSFVLPAAEDFRGILILNLNDSEFVKIWFGSTL